MPTDGWYNYIDFLGRTVVFPAPTDATNEMLRAIREEVDALNARYGNGKVFSARHGEDEEAERLREKLRKLTEM